MFRCKKHPTGLHDTVRGAKPCSECGAQTYDTYALCERCSKYLDRCEVCGTAAESDINPALVAAFTSRQAVALRQQVKTARELQTNNYPSILGPAYQHLIRAAQAKFADAIAPLKVKLAADLEADKTVQSIMDEMSALRSQEYTEANRQKASELQDALSVAARPHDDAFDAAKAPHIDTFNREIAPFERVHSAVWTALKTVTQQMIDEGEACLAALIEEARASK